MRGMSDGQTIDALPFMKMHGAGNDFVVIDSREGVPVSADLARALGDRHRGGALISWPKSCPRMKHPTSGCDSGMPMGRSQGPVEMRPAVLPRIS